MVPMSKAQAVIFLELLLAKSLDIIPHLSSFRASRSFSFRPFPFPGKGRKGFLEFCFDVASQCSLKKTKWSIYNISERDAYLVRSGGFDFKG